jgi:hypothetical protein
MNKNAQISMMILDRMARGMELRAAFDEVLGEGAYNKLAGEVYDELRAR